jgi:hypothetical protein
VKKKEDNSKKARIKREEIRLSKIYSDIEEKRKATVQGLIQRAAHMRITLDDFANDLDEKGFVELFSQGEQAPYERKRPTADLYNTMNTNYQKIIKQLTDLLPKCEDKPDQDDGYNDFVGGRDDD